MLSFSKGLNRLIVSLFLFFWGPAVSAQPDPENDPWETVNRKIFTFNESLDAYFLKPLATGYRFVTPGVVDKGVTNAFNNLDDVNTVANSLLQLKGQKAMWSTSRVMFNSTFGVLGFFDVATEFGLERSPEDLGQTLAFWGIPQGNYIVLPFLGPSTVRDGSARLVESFSLNTLSLVVDNSGAVFGLSALKLVDLRADLIPKEGLIIGDKYSFVRSTYLQYRQFLINDGEVADPFATEDESYLDDF